MRWICRIALVACTATALLHAEAAPAESTTSSAEPTALELYHARRDAEAGEAFERRLAANPADHEALYYLGRLAKRRGDWAAVAARYERCTELAPTNALYWADLGEAYGKLAGKAGLFQQLPLARKCHAALEKAVALEPNNLEYRQGLLAFCEKAPAIAGGGRDKALAQASAISGFDPYAGAMATAGIHARAGNVAAAEMAYHEAARANQEADEPLVGLARLMTEAGRYPEAFAALDTVLARAPQNADALFAFGQTAARAGQRLTAGEQAIGQYLALERRPARSPSPALAQVCLGDLLLAAGRAEAARSAYEAALQLEPGLKPAAQALQRLSR